MKWIYHKVLVPLGKILKWIYSVGIVNAGKILKQIYYPVLVGILSLAAVFGIISPFIWNRISEELPPPGLIDLSVLLTLILALLGLFAGLGYWVLRNRLGESLGKEIRREAKAALARAVGMTAYAAWRAWRIDRKNPQLLVQAVDMQKYAYEELIAEMTPEELRKVADILPEVRIYQQKSNLAGYIAYQEHYFPHVSADDVSLARKLGKETYEKALKVGDDCDWCANYAGVLKVFGTPAEKKKAEEIMAEIKPRIKKNEEWQEYRELFTTPQF